VLYENTAALAPQRKLSASADNEHGAINSAHRQVFMADFSE